MRPITVTVGPLTVADVEAVFKAAAVAGAGYLTLDGNAVVDGVAVLDAPRLVYFEGTSPLPSVDFTITGTTWGGAPASEVVSAANIDGGVETVQSFLTVTSVYASAGSGGDDVYIGTNDKATTAWVRLDPWSVGNTAIQINASGSVSYTLQQTMDDPNDPTNPVATGSMAWVDSNDTSVVGATTTKQTNYLFTPKFARVMLNTGDGSATATFVQHGVVGQ